MDIIKQKALVVDDDINVLELLKSSLEMMNFSVITCENVSSAVNALKSFRPDIILLDVSMPDGDGISFCRNLKLSNDTAGIPILMLTAFTDDNTFHDAMLFGANGFLTKPFDMEELKKRIEECIIRVNVKKENQK